MTTPRFTLFVFTLAALVTAEIAPAHPLTYPQQDTLRIVGGNLSLAMQLEIEEHEAEAIRDRFDRNADGRLDPTEVDRMRSHLVSRLRRNLVALANGTPLTFQLTASSVEDERRANEALSVGLLLEASLPTDREVRLEIRDRTHSGAHQVPLGLTVERRRIVWASDGRLTSDERGRHSVRGVYLQPSETFSMLLDH